MYDIVLFSGLVEANVDIRYDIYYLTSSYRTAGIQYIIVPRTQIPPHKFRIQSEWKNSSHISCIFPWSLKFHFKFHVMNSYNTKVLTRIWCLRLDIACVRTYNMTSARLMYDNLFD